MPQKPKFFVELFENARRRTRDRWVQVGGVASVVLILFKLFVEEQVVSAAQGLWPHLQNLARQEIGAILLAAVAIIVVVFVAVAVLAYVDSRPKPQAKPTESTSTPLTKEERDLIQPIRNAWKLRGDHATYALQSLFSEVIYPLRDQRYWGELLRPKADELEVTRRAISEVVAHDSRTPLAEVCEAFNQMYNAYASVMYWLANIDAAGDVLLDDRERYQNRLEDWMDLQYAFQDELARVDQIPELHRRLKISTHTMQIHNPALGRLMREIYERHTRPKDRISPTVDRTPPNPDGGASASVDGRPGSGT